MTGLEDRIEMTEESEELTLDALFESLERTTPEGYKVEIVEGAEKTPGGLWRCGDVEFVAEVISKGTAHNDYGPKRTAYAAAEVPVYLVADPYQRRCHICTDPKDGDYAVSTRGDFGTDIDLTGTVIDLVLTTGDFPHD
ncbi:Uma2 family endonuclease [Streptomyces capoamus]|uniref:Uma2 family endonuclease n=1 Tax=Streptomyces capoamus TaxID=68183 RepID=UPI003396A90D